MKNSYLLVLALVLALAACEEQDLRQPGALVPKTVDEDSSLPSIKVNGALFHSVAYGNPNNTMVVVIHGGPGGDFRYLLNCKAFADQGFYVVFYDQRGSGLSHRDEKSVYSMQLLFDDLSGVIQHYRKSSQQKVILLGQSWGAMLASAYVNQYPSAAAGLILCEPGGLVWSDVIDYMKRENDYGITSETLNDITYMDQFITGKPSQQEVLDYKFALLSGKASAEEDALGNQGDIPFWRLGAVVNNALVELGNREKPDWTTNLQSYKTEVLFGYSERNRAYGEEHAKHVSSAFPNVKLFKVNKAGHNFLTFDDGWNNFYPVALEYLNAHK